MPPIRPSLEAIDQPAPEGLEAQQLRRRQPVRVVHLLWRLGVGGMEVGVVKLVNHLDRTRFASSICSFNPADSLKWTLAPDVSLFEFRRRRGNDPKLVWQLYRHFTRHRPHIVHTHRWGTLCEGLLAARLAGVPIVIHGEHGTMETRSRNLTVQRWVWTRVDRVLSVSSLLADRMAREVSFPRDRITVIRNGVDLDRFARGDRTLGRQRLGLQPADLVIGTVGRLVPVKDHSTLLEALALARQWDLRFKAVIVGEGPLRAALDGQVHRLGLADWVLLAGNREDIPDVLAAYDLFVLSSRSEGLSNVILEAMASGLPVVATRVGGSAELVHQDRTGILVPAANPDALATALTRLGNAPQERHTMSAAAKLRASTEFALTTMIRRYEELYLELAAGYPILQDGEPGQG